MTDPDGSGVVIINGKVRALTPEEKEQIDRAMEQFENGDFAKHMADMKREMADLKTFNSEEFREKMEAARREFEQSALANNAELRAKVQAMMKNFDMHNMYIGHCKDGFAKDKDKDKDDKDKQKKSDESAESIDDINREQALSCGEWFAALEAGRAGCDDGVDCASGVAGVGTG